MKIKILLLTILWALLILILSIMPGKDLPSFSFWELIGIDKIGHWLFYGILCFFITKVICLNFVFKNAMSALIIGVTVSIFYGIFMEIIQGVFFASRTADYKDVLANSIGIIIMALLFRKIEFLPEKYL